MITISNLISTKNLIYLTLFLSPAYLIRFSVIKIPLNLLDILILLTIIIWLYKNKPNLSNAISDTLKKTSFILPPIILILLGLFISSLLNNNWLKELGIIKSWFILPIIFGFISFNEIKTNSDFKKMLNTILFSSILISIISIFYLIFGKLTYDERLRTFYLSPNHLAMIISPGLLIGFWNIIINKKIHLINAILILPILSALFFTHSYGAWMAIVLSLIIVSLFAHKKIILYFFLICLSFFIFEYDSDKFKQISNFTERSSLESRIMIWKSSAKIIDDNWLWGIGPGNFQEKYLAYQKYFSPYLEWAVPQPHNIFLAFWLQTGIIGLIGFLSLIILWLVKIIKILYYSKDSYQKNDSLILLTMIVYSLIHGLIDTPYWKNDLSLIFWTIIFMGATLYKK